MDDIIRSIWTVTFKSATGSPLNGGKDLQTSNVNIRLARGSAQGLPEAPPRGDVSHQLARCGR